MFEHKLDQRDLKQKQCVKWFQTDTIKCACQWKYGGKEVMARGDGRAKWKAGNRTSLDFNFVKKKITEETEDLYQSHKQGKCW